MYLAVTKALDLGIFWTKTNVWDLECPEFEYPAQSIISCSKDINVTQRV